MRFSKQTYKECPIVSLGSSDISSLIVRAGCDSFVLNFGGDGYYFAYVVDGENIEIGSHYELVFSSDTSWVSVFDDCTLTYSRHDWDIYRVNIYRAGNYGCIIQFLFKHDSVSVSNNDTVEIKE